MGRAHILRTYIIFGDIIWGYDHQWDTMFCTHFWVFYMRLMASSLYLPPWDHLKKQSWLVLISCAELICRVPLKPCFHLTTNGLHSWVWEIKFQHKLANSSSASPLIHIPATFAEAGSRVKLLPWRSFQELRNPPGIPLSLLFKEAFIPLLSCFLQRELCPILEDTVKPKRTWRLLQGYDLLNCEICHSDHWPFSPPPHHIGINAMVL